MRRYGSIILWVFVSLLPTFWVNAQDQEPVKAEIISPTAGDAVRGSIAIKGIIAVDGFISWELTFSYADDTSGSWYLIAEGEEHTINDFLSEWDTTTITDGFYNLRLTVYLKGSRRTHFILPGIQVRNYTPVEIETPIPALTTTPSTQTPQPTKIPINLQSQTLLPETPTPLPTNPIEISSPEISNSLIRGALGTLTGFLILGLYISVRKTLK